MTSRLLDYLTITRQTGDDFAHLQQEILSEKASSLGRAGERAARAVEVLRNAAPDDPLREALLKDAARAVHAYFIQRELCGFRRHNEIIRELSIPPQVLARLGAS